MTAKTCWAYWLLTLVNCAMFVDQWPETSDHQRQPIGTAALKGYLSADDLSRHLESMSKIIETTEDKRHNLEVDLIDCTQTVQFHQGWRYMVRPPQIKDRSCCRIDDGTTELVVRQAGQRRVAVVWPTKHRWHDQWFVGGQRQATTYCRPLLSQSNKTRRVVFSTYVHPDKSALM